MGYKLSNIITANRLMVGYIYHYCTAFKFIKLLVSSKSNRIQKCAGESNWSERRLSTPRNGPRRATKATVSLWVSLWSWSVLWGVECHRVQVLISGSHRVNQTSSEASASLKREEKLKQTIERKEYMQHGKILRWRSSVLSKNQALVFHFLIETQEGVGHHHFGD